MTQSFEEFLNKYIFECRDKGCGNKEKSAIHINHLGEWAWNIWIEEIKELSNQVHGEAWNVIRLELSSDGICQIERAENLLNQYAERAGLEETAFNLHNLAWRIWATCLNKEEVKKRLKGLR